MNSLATCHLLTPPEPREANPTDGQASNLSQVLAQYEEALSENKKATCELMTTNNDLTVFLLSRPTLLIGFWKVELRLTMEARSARLWVTRESVSRYLMSSTKFS